MKFAVIIGEAEINPADVPHVAELPITLRDEKQEITKETIHFSKPLFKEHPEARTEFLNFLTKLDNKIQKSEKTLYEITPLDVLVTEPFLSVRLGLTSPKLFFRIPWIP